MIVILYVMVLTYSAKDEIITSGLCLDCHLELVSSLYVYCVCGGLDRLCKIKIKSC